MSKSKEELAREYTNKKQWNSAAYNLVCENAFLAGVESQQSKISYMVNRDIEIQVEHLSELTALKDRLSISEYNLELRTDELRSAIDNSDESKWVYWRKMYTTTRDSYLILKNRLALATEFIKSIANECDCTELCECSTEISVNAREYLKSLGDGNE